LWLRCKLAASGLGFRERPACADIAPTIWMRTRIASPETRLPATATLPVSWIKVRAAPMGTHSVMLPVCASLPGATDVDEIVGDDAEPDPALHSGLALVAAAVEAVSAFGTPIAAAALGTALRPRPKASEPDVRIARIRLSDKSSCLRPRHVVPKPAQTYEPEVPVEVRKWIGPALAALGFMLDAQRPSSSALRPPTPHPVFAQVADFRGDQAIAERAGNPAVARVGRLIAPFRQVDVLRARKWLV
jgi:hypothetical protein